MPVSNRYILQLAVNIFQAYVNKATDLDISFLRGRSRYTDAKLIKYGEDLSTFYIEILTQSLRPSFLVSMKAVQSPSL